MISSKAMRRVCLNLLLVSGLVFSARADTTQAYVHFGAFLLGEVPSTSQTSRRPRVGYLPIGTVVSYDPEAPRTRIFNYSEDVQDFENYIHVHSEIGFAGFIRDDLVTDLDAREVLVPIGYRMIVRAIESDDELARLSRAEDAKDSHPVEIIGEDAEYFFIKPARADDPLLEFAEGRVKKPLVESGRLLRLSNHPDRFVPDIRRGSTTEFLEEKLAGVTDYIRRKTGEDSETIIAFFREMNALRCRLTTSADMQLSGKILGNGFGLDLNFMLAERNAIYSIKTLSYSLDGRDYTSYYQLHDVRCIDGIPHRLANLVLLEADNPSRQIIVSVEDLPEGLKTNWVRFDTGSSGKMIIVDGVKAYDSFMKHIGKSPYLRDLPHRDRLILSHALLEELAQFSTPD